MHNANINLVMVGMIQLLNTLPPLKTNRFSRIKPGDIVCDPMCGGGTIPIEVI